MFEAKSHHKHSPVILQSFYSKLKGNVEDSLGGWTCKPVAPVSSPPLLMPLAGFVLGCTEFNFLDVIQELDSMLPASVQ